MYVYVCTVCMWIWSQTSCLLPDIFLVFSLPTSTLIRYTFIAPPPLPCTVLPISLPLRKLSALFLTLSACRSKPTNTLYAFVNYCFSIYLNIILSPIFGVPNVVLGWHFLNITYMHFSLYVTSQTNLPFLIWSPNVSRLLCKLWSLTVRNSLNSPVNHSFKFKCPTQHYTRFLDLHQTGLLKWITTAPYVEISAGILTCYWLNNWDPIPVGTS